MELTAYSYCADVAFRGSLELGSECCIPRTDYFLRATRFSALRSRSVSLCGLTLHNNNHLQVTGLALAGSEI